VATDARRLWHLCLVDGSLDERRARDGVERILATRPAGALPVVSRFLRLVKLDRARHVARVASADPLDAELRGAVEAALARRYGRELPATFVVDPALIGGIRVRVGSDVYDGTVRGALDELEASF
jgi:F-type H+-transporting ATPase subunit delta